MRKQGLKSARRRSAKLGLDGQVRTLLVCMDGKCGKCASQKQMDKTWRYLKSRAKTLKPILKLQCIRAGCFGICAAGPLIAVQPDGTWYGKCTPDVVERIIQEHLIGGRIVEEFLIAQSEPIEQSEPELACIDIASA